ncbi:MAG: PDC sensor domain-containing protein [Candidatus Bathyarchaeota archaeon]|nr:PDC sensor domain-containing protein [Candidatus Bathyarchaeota archaeon]
MTKSKSIALVLVVLLIVSLAFNIYQWSNNASLTKQSSKQEMASTLIHDAAAINAELLRLDRLVSEACQKLSATGLTGSAAETVLSDLYTQNPHIIVNAATADENDVLLAVQPSNYSDIVGQDIKDQEQNVEMHRTMRPALSNLIMLVEGFPGIVLVSPIFDANNQFIGSLSIVFQPQELMHPIVSASATGTYYTIYALQKNGTLIYDANAKTSGEQGKNIFTDEEYAGYTELQTFIHQAVDTQSGYGTYSFFDDLSPSRPLISKEGFWTTVGIYNTDWRLVIAQPLNQ